MVDNISDIIDCEELDKDTVDLEVLDQLFCKKYYLLAEQAVSIGKSYINKLSVTKSLKLAVSVSNKTIEAYEINKTSVSQVCRLSGHKKDLTEVVYSPIDDNLIYSAGEEGLVKLWDTRANGSCVQEYKDEEEELVRPYQCLDVSCDGRILCAGSQVVEDDAYLVFWDQRVTKPLGGYWNSHTDDITQVKFHKSKKEILATGSVDGLLNVFNITEKSEDDALTYSLNVENTVDKLSWLDDTRVACMTQSNDLQLWDIESGDMLRSYTREKIARGNKRSNPCCCYLVDCHMSAEDTPVLLAGSYGGKGDLLRMVSMSEKKLKPRANFSQNKQTVRCSWHCPQRDLLITTGESGFISVWSGTQEYIDNGATHKVTDELKKLRVKRHKPY